MALTRRVAGNAEGAARADAVSAYAAPGRSGIALGSGFRHRGYFGSLVNFEVDQT